MRKGDWPGNNTKNAKILHPRTSRIRSGQRNHAGVCCARGSAEIWSSKELLAQVGRSLDRDHFGAERRQSDELGVRLEQLQAHPGGNSAKMCLAPRLRQETTMSLK